MKNIRVELEWSWRPLGGGLTEIRWNSVVVMGTSDGDKRNGIGDEEGEG